MPNPKIIFIDWYKTLSNSLFWEQSNDFKTISQWLFKENSNLINPWMKGEYTAEAICKKIAFGTKLDFNQIFNSLIESCQKMSYSRPEIPRLIKNIRKKGIKVVIATDNMDTFSRFTKPGLKLGNIFNDFLISYDLKILKQETELESIPFFEKYLQDRGLKNEEVVLIDDGDDKTGVYGKLGLKIDLVKSSNDVVNFLEKYS